MLKVTYRYWNLMAPLLVRSLKRQYGKEFAGKTARKLIARVIMTMY